MSAGRIWRRRLIALGVLAALIVAGYWFWLRDSSLVAVEDVEVEGASTNAAEIQAALEPVAREMTTLNIDDQQLVEAAGAGGLCASVTALCGATSAAARRGGRRCCRRTRSWRRSGRPRA